MQIFLWLGKNNSKQPSEVVRIPLYNIKIHETVPKACADVSSWVTYIENTQET